MYDNKQHRPTQQMVNFGKGFGSGQGCNAPLHTTLNIGEVMTMEKWYPLAYEHNMEVGDFRRYKCYECGHSFHFDEMVDGGLCVYCAEEQGKNKPNNEGNERDG